jgi:hypothetical protein
MSLISTIASQKPAGVVHRRFAVCQLAPYIEQKLTSHAR